MCGIIRGKRRDNHPVGKAIHKRYRKQRDRGHEGFGLLTIDKGRVSGIYRFEKESEAEDALRNCKSADILFHHRLPTSTPNYKDMTHPIVVSNKMLDRDYYVVHNGVLTNHHLLRAKHEKLGFKYTTIMEDIHTIRTRSGDVSTSTEKFNDSEALAIEVALYLDGKQNSIEAIGTIAFFCFETDKKGNVITEHYGRNSGNPLTVEDNNDLYFVRTVGGDRKIDENEIISVDYKTRKGTFRPVDVGSLGYKYSQKEHRHMGFHEDEDLQYFPDADLPVRDVPARDLSKPIKSFLQPRMALPAGVEDPSHVAKNDWLDHDFDQDFNSYKLTDEYWLDLASEIESLDDDIAMCKEKLKDDTLTDEEIVYNQEYLTECVEVRQQKQEEADALYEYINQKNTKI